MHALGDVLAGWADRVAAGWADGTSAVAEPFLNMSLPDGTECDTSTSPRLLKPPLAAAAAG